MSVSVIIPTYNRAHVLGEAIASVLAQTYREWELIIVDDGSTDATAATIEELYAADPRVTYRKVSNGGAARARNKGVELASGRYITFLDSDDVVDPAWLSRLVSELEASDCELVSCGVTLIAANGEQTVVLPKKMSPAFNGFTMKMTNGGSFMLTKSLFQRVGGYDPQLRSGQHTELGLRVAKQLHLEGGTACTINEPLVNVINRGGKSIRSDSEATYAGTTYFIEKHRNYLLEKHPPMLATFLSVAGVRSQFRGHFPEAKAYLKESIRLQPRRLVNYARLVRVYLAQLTNK